MKWSDSNSRLENPILSVFSPLFEQIKIYDLNSVQISCILSMQMTNYTVSLESKLLAWDIKLKNVREKL